MKGSIIISIDTPIALLHPTRMRSVCISIFMSALGILALSSEKVLAQSGSSYALPAPGYDIALANNGAAVVSFNGLNSLWVRGSNKIARTVDYQSNSFKLQIKADGSFAYLLGAEGDRNLYIHNFATDGIAVRSFDVAAVDFALAPDGLNVFVGLNNKTGVVSDTRNFHDHTVALRGQPGAVVISPDSSVAYVAVGSSPSTIIKVSLASHAVLQRLAVKGTLEKLEISSTGNELYAIVSRSEGAGKVSRSLIVQSTVSRKILASRTLRVSGTGTPTFDIDAGAKNIFVSSSSPFLVGSRKAGVVRFSVSKGGAVSAPTSFALRNVGAGAISYSESARSLGVIDPGRQRALFLKTP